MAENTGLTAADVALLTRDTGFGDGNAFMWIFALLILAGGGFGGIGGWGNGGGVSTLNADMQRGFDAQNLQAQTRDILGAVTAGTAQSVAATNQVYHDIVGNLGDKYMELARDVAGVGTAVQQSIANATECCCNTKMLIAETSAGLAAQIAQNKYENALAMAGMEQRITAKMDQNEITSLRDQISQLQLAQATSGMLRFPNSWSYGAGPFPPIFGCPSNNI